MKWDNRNEAVNINMPGIYAIAISDQNLEGDFSFSEKIVYFGMTNSQGGLRSRLKAFDNTIKDKTGHGGAATRRRGQPGAPAGCPGEVVAPRRRRRGRIRSFRGTPLTVRVVRRTLR